jgi:hypothetical protein
MSKKQYSLMLVLALIAGLVGGVVSSQFFVGYPAYAKQEVKKTKEIPPQYKTIEAGEIQLLDTSGKTRIHLYTDINGNPSIALMGAEGEPPRIWLRVDEQNGARLFMFRKPEKKGKIDSFFNVSEDRGLHLNESTLTLLESGLLIKDRNGKVIWKAP